MILEKMHYGLLTGNIPGDWVGVDVSRGGRRQVRRGQEHLLIKGLPARLGGKAAFLQVDRKRSHLVRLIQEVLIPDA